MTRSVTRTQRKLDDYRNFWRPSLPLLFSLPPKRKPQTIKICSLIPHEPKTNKERRRRRMVLWEITLGTAYFLGLRRTYRLALRIQRRVISPKHPKIREFAHRRTRAVFDVAVSVHKNIQQRDIDLGRNLGNWILRWLDRMKPSANIRAPPELKLPKNGSSLGMRMTKQVNSSHQKNPGNTHIRNQESDRHMFSSITNGLPKTLPSISMMMRARRTSGTMTQYRNLFTDRPDAFRPDYNRGSFGGVIRKDIMQWMQQN